MNVIQPTKTAGEFYIPALGKTVQLIEWREDDYQDSVTQALGAVTAGTSLELFRDLSSKNVQHCNLKTPRRIPSGSEFVMNRVGVLIHQAFSNTLVVAADILKVAYNASLTFKVNDRLIVEGALYKFATGYGMAGATTENNTSLISTGVASAAAAPNLLVAQPVKDDDDLNGTIDFKSDSWITGAAVMPTLAGRSVMSIILHGLIKKPQGK